MTQQERAEQVAHTYYSLGPTNLIDLIADALTATRRAALLEAKVEVTLYIEKMSGKIPNADAHKINLYARIDRLAQEGALSIDLSPTIQDDGDYGEHF